MLLSHASELEPVLKKKKVSVAKKVAQKSFEAVKKAQLTPEMRKHRQFTGSLSNKGGRKSSTEIGGGF